MLDIIFFRGSSVLSEY